MATHIAILPPASLHDDGSRGTRGHVFEATIEPTWSMHLQSITALMAFQNASFEELRFQDSIPWFHMPPRRPPAPLLERDVLRAVGYVVLDKPRWWEAFCQEDEARKAMLDEVVMRTTRAVCHDAAAHVIHWMGPTARKARTEGCDLRLSVLVEWWPVELASGVGLGEERDREQLTEQPLLSCDRYLLLAWIALREICLADKVAWPTDWGIATCVCTNLHPLVGCVLTTMMDILDRFQRLPPICTNEIFRAEVLRGDASISSLFVSAVTGQLPAIVSDMVVIQSFSYLYLRSIELTHQPERDSIAPGPIQGTYVRDDIDSSCLGGTAELALAWCAVDLEGGVAMVQSYPENPFQSISSEIFHRSKVLVEELIPSFEKTLAEAAIHYSESLIQYHPGEEVVTSLKMPRRAVLKASPSCPQRKNELSLKGRQFAVVVSVESIDYTSHGHPDIQQSWQDNIFKLSGRGSEGGAVAFVVVETSNIATVHLHVEGALQSEQSGDCDSGIPTELMARNTSLVRGESRDELSLHPNRAVVIPAYAKYRFGNARLLDPTQPGNLVIQVVTLRNPWSESTAFGCLRDIYESLQGTRQSNTVDSDSDVVIDMEDDVCAGQNPVYPLSVQLVGRSAEEDRYQHYARDLKPGVCMYGTSLETAHQVSPTELLFSLRTQEPACMRSKSNVDFQVLQLLSEITNPPSWWQENPHRIDSEPVQQVNQRYISTCLENQLRRELQSTASQLVRASKSKANAESSSETSSSGESVADSSFEGAAHILIQLSMLQNLHRSLATGRSADFVPVIPDLVKLVVEYGACAGSESRVCVLQSFMGPKYPADQLVNVMDQACKSVNEKANRWTAQFASLIEAQRDSALSNTRHSPALDTSVGGGFVNDSLDHLLSGHYRPSGPIASIAYRAMYISSSIQATMQRQSTLFRLSRSSALIEPHRFAKLEATICANSRPSAVSSRFPNLAPSDVKIELDGTVRFLSYVSGVPLRHQSTIINPIEHLTTAFVPLFEDVLTSLSDKDLTSQRFFVDDIATKTHMDPPASRVSRWSLRGRVLQIAVQVIEIEVDAHQSAPKHWSICNDGKLNILATGKFVAGALNVSRPRATFYNRKSSASRSVGHIDDYPGRCCAFPQRYK